MCELAFKEIETYREEGEKKQRPKGEEMYYEMKKEGRKGESKPKPGLDGERVVLVAKLDEEEDKRGANGFLEKE